MITKADRSATERKVEGAHYTPEALAQFVANTIASAIHPAQKKTVLRAIDPAVGDGALLEALFLALRRHEFHHVAAVGLDTSHHALAAAAKRLHAFRDEVSLLPSDFLTITSEQTGLFTAHDEKLDSFDIAIANPPYVRTQVLGAARSQELAASFGLTGRVDLYHAFVQTLARVLKPGGVAGLIVSNRFMTTQSGRVLRRSIPSDFEILGVFDFGDTRLFEAAVLPAVLILRRRSGSSAEEPTPFASIYSVPAQGNERSVDSVIAAMSLGGRVRLATGETFEVKNGLLDRGRESDSIWRVSTVESDRWLSTVAANTALTFGDVGTVRVGIKTTADKVFIRSDWEAATGGYVPELLRPLTTHHRARPFRAMDVIGGPQVLYPHEVLDGKRKSVDLAQHPRAASYLESHRTTLEARRYVTEAGRKWFEIWVPHDPNAWSAPKLVWRDISEGPVFWFDDTGTVVNGDCYWLAADSGDIELLWLALAVANSTFVERFYDQRFNNKLYARRRRFITQYVRDFPLPDPTTTRSKRMVELAKDAHRLAGEQCTVELIEEIDALVWMSFGVSREECCRQANL